MCGIPPAECHLIVLEANETAIGDCHAMSVSAEIAKHQFRPAERGLRIDHPAQSEKLADEAAKQFGLRQALQHAMEPQLPGSVSLPQTFYE